MSKTSEIGPIREDPHDEKQTAPQTTRAVLPSTPSCPAEAPQEPGTSKSPSEEPCEFDGRPCAWVTEDVDEDGSWDAYCTKCYRYRDWTKEELGE